MPIPEFIDACDEFIRVCASSGCRVVIAEQTRNLVEQEATLFIKVIAGATIQPEMQVGK